MTQRKSDEQNVHNGPLTALQDVMPNSQKSRRANPAGHNSQA